MEHVVLCFYSSYYAPGSVSSIPGEPWEKLLMKVKMLPPLQPPPSLQPVLRPMSSFGIKQHPCEKINLAIVTKGNCSA